MNYFAFSGLFNVVVFLFVALVIFFKKDKPRAAKYLQLFNISAMIWALGYFFWQRAASYEVALMWVKIFMVGTIFAPAGFFHFILVTINRDAALKRWIKLSYLLVPIFMLLSFFSRTFTTGLTTKMGIAYFPTGGPSFHVFIFYFFSLMIWAHIEIFRAYRRATGPKKSFLKLFGISTAVAIGSASVNYFLWYDIPIKPWTTPIASIYSFYITFLLIKGKFFNLKIFTFEFAASIILLILFIQLIFSKKLVGGSVQWVTYGMLIMVAVIIIRSGMHEKSYRNKIESLNTALKDSIHRVINNLNIPVIIFKTDTSIVYANKKASDFFQNNPHTLYASIGEFIDSANNPAFDSYIREYLKNGTDKFVTIMQHPLIRQVEIQFAPFPLEHDERGAILMIHDRQPPWGTVFRADTFEPLSDAAVKIFDVESKKLVEAKVTDKLGRFGFMASEGTYVIQAEKKGFRAGPPDNGIGYLGETITITDDNLMDLNVNILVDPETKKRVPRKLRPSALSYPHAWS